MENNLPLGWVETSLSSVVFFQEGPGLRTMQMGLTGIPFLNIRTFNDDETLDKTKCKFVKIGEFNNRYEHFLLNEGDIVVSSSGTLGKAIVIRKEDLPVMLNTSVIRFRTESEKVVTQKYLKYFLKSDLFYKQIQEQKTGMAIDNYGPSHLQTMQILIPPIAEQHRIVEKLDAVMQKVESNKRRLAKIPKLLKRFRQSVLAAAVSGKLTENWRMENPSLESGEAFMSKIKQLRINRYDEACKLAKKENKRKPSNYDNYEVNLRSDYDLFEIPEKWIWVDFRFLMSEDEPFCYGVVQPGGESVDGNYLIRAGDLKNNSVDTSSLRTISKAVDKEYSRSKVKGGEILITVVGAGIGECGIVPNSCAGYNIARAVAKVPIKDFDAKYLLNWLNSSFANKCMKDEAREVARPTLNLEQLRTIPIALPSFEEQKEIVRIIEQLFAFSDKLEIRYTKAKALLDKIPQSILAKAFRGELISQNPNDEPATALLERIKKETHIKVVFFHFCIS